MQIRKMHAGDLVALQSLYLSSRISTFSWRSANDFKLADFAKDTKGETIIVAERDGIFVGFCSIWEDSFIHNLFVDDGHKSKGVGKALLTYAFANLLKKPVRLKCIIQNKAACAFYEGNGWQIETTSPPTEQEPYHTYVMI